MSAEDECSICISSLKDPIVVTECGHSFHQLCAETWENSQAAYEKTCALCRSVLKVENCMDVWARATAKEFEVINRYPENVGVFIVYDDEDDEFFGNVDRATWIFEYEHVANVHPNSWMEFFVGLGDTDSLIAFNLAQSGKAHAKIWSEAGDPPTELGFCRRCRAFVYTEDEDMYSHLQGCFAGYSFANTVSV